MYSSFFLLIIGLLLVQAACILPENGCKKDNDDKECKEGIVGNSTTPFASILGTIVEDFKAITIRNAIMGNGTNCPAMSVIFARGTFEPGNVGILTGPPFFDAIADYMNGTGHLSVQGVEYPADVAGFLAGGSAAGAEKMASLLNSTLTLCPSSLVTLAGYLPPPPSPRPPCQEYHPSSSSGTPKTAP